MALPMHPGLTADEEREVIAVVTDAIRRLGRGADPGEAAGVRSGASAARPGS